MKSEQRKRINIGSWRSEDGEQKPRWRDRQQAERSEDDRKEVNKDPKKIAISHYHRIKKPWIILPYGAYYNKEILTAKSGDILIFSDRIEREIEYLHPVKFNSSFTDYFCRKTYGITINRLKERWVIDLEFEGYNVQAIHEDRVMLVFLKEIPQEEPKKRKKK